MAKTVLTFDDARRICLEMPGVEEGTSYESPAFKVKGKVLACRPTNKAAEEGSLAVCMDFEQRAALLDEMPDAFYLPEHYRKYEWVLVRLGKVNEEQLRGLLQTACRVAEGQGRKKGKRGGEK